MLIECQQYTQIPTFYYSNFIIDLQNLKFIALKFQNSTLSDSKTLMRRSRDSNSWFQFSWFSWFLRIQHSHDSKIIWSCYTQISWLLPFHSNFYIKFERKALNFRILIDSKLLSSNVFVLNLIPNFSFKFGHFDQFDLFTQIPTFWIDFLFRKHERSPHFYLSVSLKFQHFDQSFLVILKYYLYIQIATVWLILTWIQHFNEFVLYTQISTFCLIINFNILHFHSNFNILIYCLLDLNASNFRVLTTQDM